MKLLGESSKVDVQQVEFSFELKLCISEVSCLQSKHGQIHKSTEFASRELVFDRWLAPWLTLPSLTATWYKTNAFGILVAEEAMWQETK